MKFGTGVYIEKLWAQGEFKLNSYRSNTTRILHEAQIQIYSNDFLKSGTT
jgi:hypothetical protein